MKRLLPICGLLWSALASAQFVPGQLLTAAELNSQFALYAPLAGAAFTGPVSVAGTFTMPASTVLPNGVSATEQGYLDNSTLVATNNFVKRSILAATGTIPIANVTGGIYNFQTTGSGVQIVVLASGGAITGVLTIPTAGTNYQVGDCLLMVGGNGDAILRVTSLSGSGVATASVVYGGTGYTTGIQLSGMALPPGSRDGVITGALTSPLTIIIPAGTYLQGSRRIVFNNNTTGAFTTTVKLSNGAGSSTGTGVVLPQGTNNSASAVLYTDGQNDVWLADSPLGIGALSSSSGSVPLTSLATQAANTIVANATGSTATPTAVTVTGCNGAAQALQWTNGTGFGCNSTIATSGANANITSLSGLSTALSVAQGGTGRATLTTHGVLVGEGTSAINQLAVGTTGQVLVGSTGADPAFGTSVGGLTFTAAITPQSTGGIVGTTTNDNANAGSFGEYPNSTVLAGSAVSLATGVTSNVTSLSLTAGDWTCSGTVGFNPGGTTVTSSEGGWISVVSATLATAPNAGAYVFLNGLSSTGGTNQDTLAVGTVRISLASTTTVYLEAFSTFSVSTQAAYGFLGCRRAR